MLFRRLPAAQNGHMRPVRPALAAPTVVTERLFVRYLRVKLADEEHRPAARPSAAGQHSLLYRLMHYFISRRYPVMTAEHLDEPPPATHGSAG